jgi:hypothetical protein
MLLRQSQTAQYKDSIKRAEEQTTKEIRRKLKEIGSAKNDNFDSVIQEIPVVTAFPMLFQSLLLSAPKVIDSSSSLSLAQLQEGAEATKGLQLFQSYFRLANNFTTQKLKGLKRDVQLLLQELNNLVCRHYFLLTIQKIRQISSTTLATASKYRKKKGRMLGDIVLVLENYEKVSDSISRTIA